jgi:hypothetical protein
MILIIDMKPPSKSLHFPQNSFSNPSDLRLEAFEKCGELLVCNVSARNIVARPGAARPAQARKGLKLF